MLSRAYVCKFINSTDHDNIARGQGRGQGKGRGRDILVLEPAMAEDQQLQQIEGQVESLSAGIGDHEDRVVSGMQVEWWFPSLRSDFPCYDGSEDPTLWICRTEQFFEFQGTALDDQDRLTAYHLEKDAQLWYQRCKTQQHSITWESMKAQFERLLARAGTLTDKQEDECFISGLKEGIRANV
ncbi:hypothetical protein Patl1_05511 [Pistacia atlantica]|uniref:Uncharacterized protein n=1 Tax=Pistacia atlantica TaxID=434234 RepID=A0ACC1BW46_9ROSI|nr:hypothetical protein Patl1_05511 [Pistacia atlantica]